jgi:hypothetical protein
MQASATGGGGWGSAEAPAAAPPEPEPSQPEPSQPEPSQVAAAAGSETYGGEEGEMEDGDLREGEAGGAAAAAGSEPDEQDEDEAEGEALARAQALLDELSAEGVSQARAGQVGSGDVCAGTCAHVHEAYAYRASTPQDPELQRRAIDEVRALLADLRASRARLDYPDYQAKPDSPKPVGEHQVLVVNVLKVRKDGSFQ